MDDAGAADTGAVLVIGETGGLAAAVLRRLELAGTPARAAGTPSDSELSAELCSGDWRAVAIVTRDDVLALRLTLLCAHVRPQLPLWVTMFDRTVMRGLQHDLPALHIVSPSELVARELADACYELAAGRIARRAGVRIVDDALRLMAYAGVGLALALAVDAASGAIALHEGVVNAFFYSTRSVATVAGTPGVGHAPLWYKIVSVLDVIAALLLVAVFTAALVRRLSRPRLTTLFGPRAAPGRGHLLLVGFGQVGFRLAQALRERGAPVLAIERDPEAPCVRLARRAGIPVSVGRGDDREVLERAGIRRCAAVAAVTSADLVNVEVCLAAAELSPQTALVMRLGDGDVAAETDSLLHLGRICDAHRIAADTLAAGLTV
ncbi:MAG TPA: NAD(P)-binding protein [Solirubrobacteraceae bacterium]|nr:NAD(P)-binding protein [Solirubrobacteraceae bacterium]